VVGLHCQIIRRRSFSPSFSPSLRLVSRVKSILARRRQGIGTLAECSHYLSNPDMASETTSLRDVYSVLVDNVKEQDVKIRNVHTNSKQANQAAQDEVEDRLARANASGSTSVHGPTMRGVFKATVGGLWLFIHTGLPDEDPDKAGFIVTVVKREVIN